MSGTTPPAARRPVRRAWVVALALLTVVAWLPLVLPLAASALAAWQGCPLDEAAAHPCLVAGYDVGEALVVMFVMGWAMLLTLPLMAGTVVGWLIVWWRGRRG